MDETPTDDLPPAPHLPKRNETGKVPLTPEALEKLFRAARAQFSNDLPGLLNENQGRWVAYRGNRLLNIDFSEFEAEKAAMAADFPLEEVRSFWIMSGEDEYDDEIA